MAKPIPPPGLVLLTSPDWVDYELLDSGGGAKLERYGAFIFVRPEHQAVWQPSLPPDNWKAAHAIFQSTGEESGGHWQFNQPVDPSWNMQYKGLKFQPRPRPRATWESSPSRQLIGIGWAIW